MAYCHECGSEVAENDVFCPFCGITLQPTIVAGQDNDSTENKSEENILSSSDEEKNLIDAQESTNSKIEESEIIGEDKAVLQGETGESAQTPEIPVGEESFHDFPDAKSIFNKQESQTELSGDETPSAKKESVENAVATDSEQIAERFYNPTESNLSDYEEVEIKELSEVEESETDSADKPAEIEEPDFSATIPYISKEKINEKIKAKGAEPEKPEDIQKPEAVNAIEKPAEELELPETDLSQHKFDSVRIMEKEDESEENFADQSSFAKSSKEESPAEKAAVAHAREKEARSYTTPNFGQSDTDGKKSKQLQPLNEGTVLNGRYEIVRKIGGGGMGAVYLASDKNLGGVLRAVKEMVQSYIEGEQQEKAVNDFKRESLLLTSLEHQSIPTIYDYFLEDKEGRFYLVMKYISGGDLAARLRSSPEGRIDEKSVTEWAIQIADVLDYLHNRQPPIVYRDLKPANIMIDGNSGRAMLIDFGIARWINKEEKGVTAVGTMGYAPPELFSGNVEPRSDIYSLGSTMFHLLTGADPQSNPLLIFDFQKNPRPRHINPQLSDQMEKILMRSVEYSAEKRFKSAAEMRRMLEEHLESLKRHKVTFGVKENPASVALSDQTVFCGFCGQKIVASDMFCAFCGAKQPLAQKGVHSENYLSTPLTARLLIIGTNELETPAYKIEKDENLVGRRDPMSNIFPEVDLSKYDPQTKISRRHARIWREGNRFLVEDLGSSNGTVVLPVVSDTVRLLPHQPYTLTNGDKLKLGDTTLHFIIG